MENSHIASLSENENFKDKRVLLRLDFDHLFEKHYHSGKAESFYIAARTLEYLLKSKAKVIIAPSFEVVNKKKKPEYTTEPFARYICELYNCNAYMTEEVYGRLPLKLSQDLQPGSILFLENLFGIEEEGESDKTFAEKLSLLADIYINEAFSLSDNELASNTSILDYFDKENVYAGFNFSDEYTNLLKLTSDESSFTLCLKNDTDPAWAITATQSLMDKIGGILLFGELSSIYSAIKNEKDTVNYSIGNLNKMKKLIKAAEVRNIKIAHITDYYATDENSKTHLVRNENINIKNYIDIGDETGKIFSELISQSNLVFWLGDMPLNKEGDLVFGSAKILETVKKNNIYVIRAGNCKTKPENINHGEDGFFNFQSTSYKTFVDAVVSGSLPVIKRLEAKFV